MEVEPELGAHLTLALNPTLEAHFHEPTLVGAVGGAGVICQSNTWPARGELACKLTVFRAVGRCNLTLRDRERTAKRARKETFVSMS